MGQPPLDKESENWRRIHRGAILEEIKPFLARVFRKSKSQNSVSAKTVGILNLCSWQRKLPSEIVSAIKAGSTDPYTLLDDFVGHLFEVDASSFSIKNSVSSVRRFLIFSGVQLNSDTFKDRVEMPRVRARTQDEPLTAALLQKAFINASPLGKRLIAFLTSTGCRVMEAIPTRYSEIDFTAKPPRIHLPESRTKDRIPRYVWLTDEAVALIQEAGLKGDDFLFPSSGRGRWKNHGAMSYWNAATTFYNAFKRAKLYREDEHGRSLITLHSIRKFTYMRLAAAIGKEYAQSIVGHSEYLDQSYWRVTLDELGQKFLEGQQAITIMAPQPLLTEDQIDQKVIDAVAKHLGAHPEEVDQKMMDAVARRSGVDPNEDASYDLKATDPKEYAEWDFDAEYKKLLDERKAPPKVAKKFGVNGKGNMYDVRVVKKTDETGIVGLLEKGYTWVQDMGAEKAVYRKKRES